MVVLFFAIGMKDLNYMSREFLDYLKKSVLKSSDQKKVVGINV